MRTWICLLGVVVLVSGQPQYPQYPPDNPPEYPPDKQPEYPPDKEPEYPTDKEPEYPPDKEPEYPPDKQPEYPPDKEPEYPPDNQPEYPPEKQQIQKTQEDGGNGKMKFELNVKDIDKMSDISIGASAVGMVHQAMMSKKTNDPHVGAIAGFGHEMLNLIGQIDDEDQHHRKKY